MLFDATSRRLFDDFDAFNAIVGELEAKGRSDLLRQGLPADAVRHRLELDMRYGNQLVTMAVVADRTRLRSVRDVIALIDLFGEDYGHRFGHGSQSPEAGIRITTIRVASYVEGETVVVRRRVADRNAEGRDGGGPAPLPLRRCGRRGGRSRLRREGAAARHGRDRPGRGYDTHHHVPGRTRLAPFHRRPRCDLVLQGHGARTMTDLAKQAFSAEDQAWVDRFLAQTTLFLGPDPEIMTNHRMAPRTAEEERLLAGPIDANDLDRVRKRIIAGLDEAFEMMEQTGAAPGAKWGDLTSAVYSASGDLIHISTGGVLAFASVLHYPVRFINKYWINDPTVGVHDGDAFIHNDARYGNIHNTDQSMILPVFHDGELIAWVATIIHEGENGAKEPGGMPSSSESAYDDGIRMSPFKIVENGEIRRDLLTFLQNSVREPKLQYQDLKVKLYSALRIKERLLALVDEVGRDAFIVSLRKSLEDVEAEARRRIRELPDGTYRVNLFSDSTLRENVLLKYPCAITVKGDELTVDWRGRGAADHEPRVQRHPGNREVRSESGDARVPVARPAARHQHDESDRGTD